MSTMAATAGNIKNSWKSSIEFNSEPVQFKEVLLKKLPILYTVYLVQSVNNNSSAFFPLYVNILVIPAMQLINKIDCV